MQIDYGEISSPRQFFTKKSHAAGYLCFAQAVEQKRPLELTGAQQGQVMVVVELALARGQVASVAVVVEVLGVGHNDVLAQQREGFVEHLAHSRKFSFVEDIGR